MTIFRTTDYLQTKSDARKFEEYFYNQALKSGLMILEHDIDHIKMVGTKWSFLKYYIRSMKKSVEHGQKLSNELKRICKVLFWR